MIGPSPTMPPAAGFSILSGVGGDLLVAPLAFTAGFDTVVVPGTPPALVTAGEMGKWNFDFPINGASFVGFGSPADANGVIYPEELKGGVGPWTVDIEGAFNANSAAGANTFLRFQPGRFIYFSMVLSKASGFGFHGCKGKIIGFNPGVDVKSNKPSPARIRVKGSAPLPAPSFVP
jgi:hypothetical protein